jgi:16S rRNA U516 pseudouridylate synthase RsuA-like enzyme
MPDSLACEATASPEESVLAPSDALSDARLLELLLPYPDASATALVAARLGTKPRRVNAAVTSYRTRSGTPSYFSFVLYKRSGCVVHKPGRDNAKTSIYDALPAGFPPVPHVGRLDQETEGLVLFTEDGPLADALLTRGVPKTYRVLVSGFGVAPCSGRLAKLAASGVPPAAALSQVAVDIAATSPSLNGLDHAVAEDAIPGASLTWADVQLTLLAAPMTIEGAHTRPAAVRRMRAHEEPPMPADTSSETAWLEVVLCEGRNRQIRRLCARSGLCVERLVRVGFGPLTLHGLTEGSARPLTDEDVASLYAAASMSRSPPRALPLPLKFAGSLSGDSLTTESYIAPADSDKLLQDARDQIDSLERLEAVLQKFFPN